MNRHGNFVVLASFLILLSGSRLYAQTASPNNSAAGPLVSSDASVQRDEQFITEIRYAFTDQQWNELSTLIGRERLVYAQNVLKQRNSECRVRHQEHVEQADALFSSATLSGSQTDIGRFLIVWGKPQKTGTEHILIASQSDREAGLVRAQYDRTTWTYTGTAGARPGEKRVVVFSDLHSEGVFELQADIFVPDDRGLPTRSFSMEEALPLSVTWQQGPAYANGGIYGSVQVANATTRELDVVILAVAVNGYGRAITLGYQRVRMLGNAMRRDIRFGSQLPPGNYVVHADAVAEIPSLSLIYRANTHAASIDVTAP